MGPGERHRRAGGTAGIEPPRRDRIGIPHLLGDHPAGARHRRHRREIGQGVAAGAQLRPFSTEILDASFKATNDLFAEVSEKNAKFKVLYDSMTAFRNEQYQWHQVCEATYDNYMIRRIRG